MTLVNTGEVVQQIDADDARVLTDRIKVAVEASWELIRQAYTSRAWAALGYSSWDDYCTREFGGSRLRLPREERQEVVGSLRDAGLSTRAIASATGQSQSQIQRDLRPGEPNGSPDEPDADEPDDEPAPDEEPAPPPLPAAKPIKGTDGKTYKPKPKAPTKSIDEMYPDETRRINAGKARVKAYGALAALDPASGADVEDMEGRQAWADLAKTLRSKADAIDAVYGVTPTIRRVQ